MENNKGIKKNYLLYKILFLLFFVLFIGSLGLNFYLFNEYDKVNDKLDDSYDEIKRTAIDLDRTKTILFDTQDKLVDTEKELMESNRSLFNILEDKYTVSDIMNKLDFLDEYIVIVPDGDREHFYTYDCYKKKFSDKGYWAFNRQSALSQGLKPGTCK